MPRTYSYSRDVTAGCFICNGYDYIWHSKNAQAVAAKHFDATGHETWVDVYMSIRYHESGKPVMKIGEREGK